MIKIQSDVGKRREVGRRRVDDQTSDALNR